MKLDQEVLGALDLVSVSEDGHQSRITEQLDRGLYVKTDKVLQALGGKWNKKAKAHLWEGNARDLIDGAIVAGEVKTARDDGFFETPEDLADELVQLANVCKTDPPMQVLEPSAGGGRIVRALIRRGADVVVYERDVARRRALEGTSATVMDRDDFMESVPQQVFHAVVMNPPFCKVGLGDHLDHTRHAFDFLKPGGTLVAVLPVSIKWRQDRRYTAFRDWYQGLGGVVRDLPDGSFKSSGTMVNTCVLVMDPISH